MTRAPVFAALAAILTALLLQATLVGPVAVSLPVSLPAVLVAAVALVGGPGSGMAFGFVAGLIADLGSSHPAGVLALCWLGIGVICGRAAERGRLRRDVAIASVVCALASVATTVLLGVLHSGGAAPWDALRAVAPAGLGDAFLALAVVPAARAFLRADSLRAPRRPATQLGVGAQR